MENDYKHQQSTNETMIDDMDKRMMDLRSNVEHLQQIKQKLDEDKIQLIKNNEQLQLQVIIIFFIYAESSTDRFCLQ
jgi:hypothetical protein